MSSRLAAPSARGAEPNPEEVDGVVEPYAGVREQYLRFADEAAEESPCFVAWGLGVAADPEVLAWVDALPGLKKQPNLVFAAARWHGVRAPGPYAGLRSAL